MDTAQHLAAVESLCARAFPSRRAGSGTGSGTGGPAYHLAALASGESFWEDDGTARIEAEEQYEAWCAALAEILTARWGEPQFVSLWSVRVRAGGGEEIPAPWRELSEAVSHLRLWRTRGRWVAVAVARHGEEQPLQLLAAVTEIDPP